MTITLATQKNQQQAKRYSLLLALLSIVTGLAVLIGGWAMDIAIFRTLLPSLVSMKANTALCFMVSGIALAAYHAQLPVWIVRVCSVFVASVGLLTLMEVLTTQSFGIDEILFLDPYSTHGFAGRMSTISAVSFIFMGLALLLLNWITARAWRPANGLAFAILINTFITILGYLYGINSLYQVSGYNPMALHTAILFFGLATAIIWSRPNVGFMRLSTSDTAAGLLIRRLLPAIIFAPPILGWCSLHGYYLDWYKIEFGLALFAASNIIVFSLLTWWAARAIENADEEKQQAQQLSSWQQAILNSADLTIISTNLNGVILTCNVGALKQLGYKEREIIGNVTPVIFHEPTELKQRAQELSERLQQTIEPTFDVFIAQAKHGINDLEWTYIRKDGSLLTVRLSTTELYNQEGQLTGFLCISRDITEKKKAIAAASASEVRFRDLFESASDLIQSTTADGKLIYVNQAWLKALQYSRTDIAGLSLSAMTLVHPKSQSSFLDMLKRVMAGETLETTEIIFIAKDNSQIIVEGSSSCQFVDGKAVAVRSIFRDITQRKHHEQQIADQQLALHNEYQRNQAVLDFANYSIVGTDKNGIITTFNKGAEALLGYTAIEMINRASPAIFHLPDEVIARSKALSAELNTFIPPSFETFVIKAQMGHADENEWTYVRKDGQQIPVLLSVTATHDDKGNIVGFLGIASDITERKRIERMKSEFVSTVSHELRTPLTSIRGAIGLVLGKASAGMSDKAKMLLETASRNCERLTLLINDILDLEKIESGMLAFHMNTVDLVALAKQSLISNEGYAQQHQVKLQFQDNGVLHARVLGDEHRLLQVFANLLSNAIKYSPTDGVVIISISQHENTFTIGFKDHGAGIPEAFRPQLFQRFAQADSSDTRAKGGTGLGLSITKAIIERHGGTISYDSQEGVGTAFYLQLPLLIETQSVIEVSSAPAKVLICEDNLDTASTLVELLALEGMMCDVAATAHIARLLLKENTYQILLLDLNLLDFDIEGLQLIRELRADKALLNLPIIVVAGRVETHQHAMIDSAMNVVDWLQTPIIREQLLSSLSLALHDTHRPSVLHVEDDADIIQVTEALIEEMAQYRHVSTLAQARLLLQQQVFDIVLLDLVLPDGSGLELLSLIRQPQTQVVIFSGQEPTSLDNHAVSAILTKSKTTNESLLTTLKTIIHYAD